MTLPDIQLNDFSIHMIPSRCPYSAIPLIRAESRTANPNYSIFTDSQLKASIDSINGKIPIDLELARLAIVTNTERYHRVWAYAQRAFDGNGKIQINLLR